MPKILFSRELMHYVDNGQMDKALSLIMKFDNCNATDAQHTYYFLQQELRDFLDSKDSPKNMKIKYGMVE